MKAVIYARVSTDEQHTENQTIVISNECDRLDLEIIGIYAENASAYKANEQNELKRLLEAIYSRAIKPNVLFVWAIDRVTRKGYEDLSPLIRKLEQCGVALYSYQEPIINTLDPQMREMMLFWLSWMAKWESKRRSERTKAGMARASLEGKTCGRPTGSTDKKKRKRPNMLTYRQASETDKRRIKKGITENTTLQAQENQAIEDFKREPL